MSKITHPTLGLIALATLIIALLFSCKKDETPDIQTFDIKQEQFSYVSGTMTVTGVFSYAGKINGVKMHVGRQTDFNDARAYEADIDGANFTVEVADLQAGTEYRYRYEVDYGSANPFFTQAKTFTTPAALPTVTTATPTNVTANSATCGGNVTASGGATVVERGVCWSTSSNPTTSGSHLAASSGGTGAFTVNVMDLTPETTYYIRAYAVNSAGTTYGSEERFTTAVSTGPNGMLPGSFSVSATRQVQFSQGNLQYMASTNTWRFAENQWDYIGSGNNNISSTYSGYIDLFGWGTSGFNHGAVCYQPWSMSETISDYYVYGQPTYNLYDQTGTADWGYNAISNGGNTTNTWCTLTHEEWSYIFNTRCTSSGIRYAKAKVNNVNGVILLPDDWSSSYYSLSNTNQSDESYTGNVITVSQWNTLEEYGAVFLPAARRRSGALVVSVCASGYYWSSSFYNSQTAWGVSFFNDYLNTDYHSSLYRGWSVRLVRDAQ